MANMCSCGELRMAGDTFVSEGVVHRKTGPCYHEQKVFDVLEDNYVDFSDPDHVDSWLRSMVNGAGIDALAKTSDEELVNLMKDTPAYGIFLRWSQTMKS